MDLIDAAFEDAGNPLDVVEHLAEMSEWSLERAGEDEITIALSATWCEVALSLTWMEDLEVLHVSCALDLKVPKKRQGAVTQLLSMVNARMWLGHFDLWDQDGTLVYRSSLPLPEGASFTTSQSVMLVESAVEAIEQFYQAFQFVVWAGQSPAKALEHALFETAGSA
ncbi:MAG: YbjN domain-containing protein [Pseudomonadota bacterium]